MKVQRFSKVLASFLIFTCLYCPLFAQEISQTDLDQLAKIGSLMTKAILDGDYDTVLEYYTEDVLLVPDFIPAIRGIDALRKQYKENQKKGIKYHSFSGTSEKRWQHGNEIFEIGTFGMAVTSRDSKRPEAFYGSYFQIWHKQNDGSLKISYNIWNLDFNPFE